MNFEQYFRAVVDGKRSGPDAVLLRFLLLLFSIPYGLVLKLRSLAYSRGLLKSYRLSKPVISVGNITVGGTGKTPVVAMLAGFCISRGKRVAVLSRGYGGSLHGETRLVSDGREIFLTPGEAGDEPFMLATRIPGLMVVIGPDRYKAGLFAQEQLDPDIFILDDGFQHLRLNRDLNILLLNQAKPLETAAYCLPGGCVNTGRLQREPILSFIPDVEIKSRTIIFPIFRSAGPPIKLPMQYFWEVVPRLRCQSLHPCAGWLLRELPILPTSLPCWMTRDLNISGKLAFADHCRYGEKEIAEIVLQKTLVGADYLITTEKDAVKLTPYLQKLGDVYAALLEVEIQDMQILVDEVEKLF